MSPSFAGEAWHMPKSFIAKNNYEPNHRTEMALNIIAVVLTRFAQKCASGMTNY
jgi:hypothetical protein